MWWMRERKWTYIAGGGIDAGAAGWNGRARGGAVSEAGAWPSARAASHR